MSDEVPVFKKDEFSAIFGGDNELVREVLAGFVSHCDELTGTMAEAARRGDREALVFAAHKLKGSAANVRAPRLSAAAAAFEKALLEEPSMNPSQRLSGVIDGYLEFRREIFALYPEMAASFSAAAKAAAGRVG